MLNVVNLDNSKYKDGNVNEKKMEIKISKKKKVMSQAKWIRNKQKMWGNFNFLCGKIIGTVACCQFYYKLTLLMKSKKISWNILKFKFFNN